jgi:hypothetical protein
MKCIICEQDKPISFFDTYVNSQNKRTYTRKQCSACWKAKRRKPEVPRPPKEIIQPRASNEEIEALPIKQVVPEGYKQCRTCKEVLPYATHFPPFSKKHTHPDCIPCRRVIDKAKRDADRIEHLETHGGSERIPPKPGTYADEYQKQYLFDVLTAFGWSYNDEKELWYKEGFKTKDGEWVRNNGLPNAGKKKAKSKNIYDNES